jgi:hypothetical protein
MLIKERKMTPEGRVKIAIDSILVSYGAYKHKPVQNGMGAPALDYHVCRQGIYAAIEAKAPGKTFTNRQRLIARLIIKRGGSVFLVDGADGAGMQELISWLHKPVPSFLGIHTAKHLAYGKNDDEPSND